MKNKIIPIILLLNIATVYFWFFPYQSSSDILSFNLAQRSLKTQNNILSTMTDINEKELKHNTEAYPFYIPTEKKNKRVHQAFKGSYDALENLKELIYYNFFRHVDSENWNDLESPNLWFRMQPFHYQIPKKVLFHDDGLQNAITVIDATQDSILAILSDENLKQKFTNDFWIDTKTLASKFKRTSVTQSLVLLISLQNQLKITEQEILQSTLNRIEKEIEENSIAFTNFIPIVSRRLRKIRVGDTFEADVFLTAFGKSDNMTATINGKPVPMKNGIGTYTITPTSVGTKKENVEIILGSTLYDSPRTYRNEFEYDVLDCD